MRLDGDLALYLLAILLFGLPIAAFAVESRRLTEAGADATLGWHLLDRLAALLRRRA